MKVTKEELIERTNESAEQTQSTVASKQKKNFGQKVKAFWNYFSTYEKIWFFSILVLAIVFSFIFPETDDPDYTLKLDNSFFAQTDETYDTLVFDGTSGQFVIEGFTIDGEEYDLSYIKKNLSEFTVDGNDASTLSLKLPVQVKTNSKIEVLCYSDSDEGELVMSAINASGNKLFTIASSLEEGFGEGYTVTQNPLDYIINVKWITFLYLLDVILNVACELLISKQSKWNFIVSLGVEVVEILVCIFCAYRFATMAVTLLFWIPCDIVSFVVWNKHKDDQKEELTVVKKLTPLQDVLIILGIIVWTAGIGYLLTFIEVPGGVFANNVAAKNIACYLDACVSAVGIVNGLLILFRYREQWIAWYISAIIETVINIMAGQWVLLVLKAGYLTNTTYGYIKWTQYIKQLDARNTTTVAAKQE